TPAGAFVERGGTLVLPLLGRDGGGVTVLGTAVPPRAEAPARQQVAGALVARPRKIAGQPLVFTETRDWTVRAGTGDRPFVLERPLGRGRIVLVADGHFLWNRGLADADAAPLAVDLARAYGAPRFPEGGTGAQVERRTAAYLLRSPALGLFVGLA